MPRFAIIVPALEEAAGIEACLAPLQPARRSGLAEIIVVDGGSRDDTRAIAAPLADRPDDRALVREQKAEVSFLD